MTWTYYLTLSQPYHSLRVALTQLNIPKHLIGSLRVAERVLVNDHYQTMNTSVTVGDQLTLIFADTDFVRPTADVQPDSAAGLEVLYETDDIIVINKHSGSKTHPNQPGEVGTTLNHVAAYLSGTAAGPFILNRLDQATSGALLMAKTPAMVPPLTAEIRDRLMHHDYLAWVHGQLGADHGTFDQPIGVDPNDKRKRQVNGLGAQNAVTHFEVLKQRHDATLVRVWLDTGRTHQIRVHFSHAGYPLIGDPLYANDARQIRLRLHAHTLTFYTPFSGEQQQVVAPVPDGFDDF